MSKLDELIREYCPNGVEYKELKDILKIRNGSDYKSFPEGDIPVYGSGGIMTYIDRFSYNKPTVLIPRKGSIDKLYYVDTPFWNVDTIFYTEIFEDVALPRYVYHCLLREHLEQYNTAGGVPSLTQTVLNKVRIPVPPLPVQSEIVRILDDYSEQTTKLISELSTELTERKKQYEYYRNSILSYKSKLDIKWMALADICDYVDYRGKTPKKTDNGVFLVTAKNIKKGYIDYSASHEYIDEAEYLDVMHRGTVKIGDLLVTTEAPCGNIAIVDREDIALAQRVIKYRPKANNVQTGFMKHYMLGKEFQTELEKQSTGSTVRGIKGSKLHLIKIPVPPIEEQERIVSFLDHFDAICNNITTAIQLEIELRQKQYEFYRNKLLNFEAIKQ